MKPYKLLIFSIFFVSILSKCADVKSEKKVLNESSNIINQLPDPLEAGWEGESVCEIVQENASIRVLKCTFPPGIGHEKHYHDPHVGYTIAGGLFKITNETGTREVNVKTGISFSNEEITTHAVQNIGETTAVFLIIEYKN